MEDGLQEFVRQHAQWMRECGREYEIYLNARGDIV